MSISRENRASRTAGAFDIRTVIAALLGFYGGVLVVGGLVAPSDADLRRAGGLNINLWAGVGLIVVAGALQTWAMLRPVVVPKRFDADHEAREVAADEAAAARR